VNIRAKPTVRALKYRMAGGPKVVRVYADQPQDFLWRWPKIENVSGSLDFTISLIERYLEADSMRCQGGGHAAGTRTDNGNMSPLRANRFL
jgi:hypothetical protein